MINNNPAVHKYLKLCSKPQKQKDPKLEQSFCLLPLLLFFFFKHFPTTSAISIFCLAKARQHKELVACGRCFIFEISFCFEYLMFVFLNQEPPLLFLVAAGFLRHCKKSKNKGWDCNSTNTMLNNQLQTNHLLTITCYRIHSICKHVRGHHRFNCHCQRSI